MATLQAVWIVNNNCRRACRHCMCKPREGCDLEETARLIEAVERHGYQPVTYICNHTAPGALELLNRVGYEYYEFKDEFPDGAAERLAAPWAPVVFSLHGHTPEIHEILCEPGNFAKTVAAIPKACAQRLPDVRVNCVTHMRNYRHVEPMAALAHELGAGTLNFIKLGYAGAGRHLPRELFLDREACLEFYREFERVRGRYRRKLKLVLDDRSFGPYYPRLVVRLARFWAWLVRKRQDYLCKGGYEKVGLDNKTKDVYFCALTVAEEGLRLGHWDDERGIQWDVRLDDQTRQETLASLGPPCNGCGLLRWCGGGCRCVAMNEHYKATGEKTLRVANKLCPTGLGVTPFLSLADVDRFVAHLYGRWFRRRPRRRAE